ncbi:MAG TPA: hypothetical protein VFN18_08265 [Solirubrobacterales bacterium]|nr:hypothetical protein [Solirubrobacterales bacterium]
MEEDKNKNVNSAFGGGSDLPDWPLVVPDTVGIFGAQVPGESEAVPGSMTIVLDLEAVPGLMEVIDRNEKGEVFDVETRWAISNPPQSDSPIAILSAHLPEIGLGFHIAILVDVYSKALMAAAKTKWVTIVDSELYGRLRSQNPFGALESGKSLAFGVDDNEPLLLVLLQRLDLPPRVPGSEATANAVEGADENDAQFVSGSAPATLAAILLPTGEAPAVVLIDPEVGKLREQLAPDSNLEGRWAAKKTDDGSIARFDCSLDGEVIASWSIMNPPQELVRAAASGHHMVAVLAKPVPEGDREAALAQMHEGVPIFAPAATEAMLPLMDSTRPD